MTPTPTSPRYVVDTTLDATAVLRRLARTGWTTREGFEIGEQPWDLTETRLTLFGRVSDSATARLALLAAVRGAGVVAITDRTSDIGQALLADLRRIGPVGTDPGTDLDEQPTSPTPGGGPQLAPEQRALLDRLAAGETIAAAAASEFLSLRTANRRIAEARAAFGVRTTREAVLAYVRLRRDDTDQG